MVGAPVFNAGDEAFLFLKQNADRLPIVFGLNQGVFRVRPDAAGARAVVQPALVLAPGGPAQTVLRGDVERRPVAVSAFVSRLRAVMASPGGEPMTRQSQVVGLAAAAVLLATMPVAAYLELGTTSSSGRTLTLKWTNSRSVTS